jgi:hypothetical protein
MMLGEFNSSNTENSEVVSWSAAIAEMADSATRARRAPLMSKRKRSAGFWADSRVCGANGKLRASSKEGEPSALN